MPDREPPVVTHEAQDPSEFSIPVEIEGLSYIFRGTLPVARDSFRLSIHVPDWEARLREIHTAGQTNSGLELQNFEENHGEIGSVALCRWPAADIHIRKIQSATWIMSKSSPYFDVHGVGRFLMNNLLAFADLKEWSVSADPRPDGRMDKVSLCNWYKRKGFVDFVECMVRYPQQPDMTQAIRS